MDARTCLVYSVDLNDPRHPPSKLPGPPMQRLARRSVLALSAAIPAGLFLGSARAADGPLESVIKARASLEALIAAFEQTRVIGLLAAPVKSKGELTIVRPDALRWELFAPDATTYWVTREGVAYRSGSTGKAGRAPPGGFGAVLGDVLVFLGGDLKTLAARYELTATEVKGGAVKLVAVPRAPEVKRLLSRLELDTNPERWGVSRVVIEEPTGDSSAIELGPNQKNPRVDPAKMKPPA